MSMLPAPLGKYIGAVGAALTHLYRPKKQCKKKPTKKPPKTKTKKKGMERTVINHPN